jgi:hypothetical protein
MADRRGTGGRGSYGNLSDFAPVTDPNRRLRRRAADPLEVEPVIQMGLDNLGVPIQRHTRGANGEVVPVTYSKADAQKYADDLTLARSRLKLSDRGFSLRIFTSPLLKDAKDNDKVEVQFVIVKRKPKPSGNEPAEASASGNEPANAPASA